MPDGSDRREVNSVAWDLLVRVTVRCSSMTDDSALSLSILEQALQAIPDSLSEDASRGAGVCGNWKQEKGWGWITLLGVALCRSL